jgi:adenylylsulfate kinase
MLGFTLWLTGLPASGKTNLAREIAPALLGLGFRTQLLDDDEIRSELSPELELTREGWSRHVRRVAYIAALLNRHDVVAIVATASPYRSLRDEARSVIPNFVEVFVRCPLEICFQRDAKGAYQRVSGGALIHVSGAQDPYEEPIAPEILVDTSNTSIAAGARQVLYQLRELAYLGPTEDEAVVLDRLNSIGYFG